jgi:phage gpG-like protein
MESATALREHDRDSAQAGAIDGNIRAMALNGGRQSGNVMAARPFLSVSDATLDEIEIEILDYIKGV